MTTTIDRDLQRAIAALDARDDEWRAALAAYYRTKHDRGPCPHREDRDAVPA